MKLSVMREYVHLCNTKNYTKTEEELYIDQSALSRHIAALEKEIGAQLIRRSKNSFQLTEAGKLVEMQFQKILQEYQDTLYGISALTQKQEGELKLGVLYYDMNRYVAAIRAAFHKAYPKVMLKLYSYQPEEVEKKLFSGELDAGILYSLSESDNNDIDYMNFFKVPIQVIFSKKHRLAAKKGITVEELAGEKVLWPDSQWKIPGVVMLGVCLCLTGTFLGGMIPTLMGIPVQLPKIGAVYAGTAGGIIATIQIVGAVMLPSYVLVPAAGGQLEMLFLLAGGCMLLAGAMVLFVKEIR